MIVVADTSVILNLCCVEHEDLLPALFEEVLIPTTVRLEFERAVLAYPRFSGLVLPSWASERLPKVIPESIAAASHLDAGEIAAIALALETSADAVLIDEAAGRRVARKLGLTAIGIVGVLVRARVVGLVSQIAPIFQQLE